MDASRARAVHDVSAHLRSTPASTTGTPMPTAQAASDAAQARARLASLVGRKLDGFQLRVEFWWSRSSQALSIVLSVVVMEVAVMKGLKLSGAEAFQSACSAACWHRLPKRLLAVACEVRGQMTSSIRDHLSDCRRGHRSAARVVEHTDTAWQAASHLPRSRIQRHRRRSQGCIQVTGQVSD